MNRARERRRNKKGFIFIISGPSGSGKTTLAQRIIRHPKLKAQFIKPASFTTRPKRSGEQQGRDYIFVSPKEFRRLFKAKKILERTRYLGYDYGTSRAYLEQAIAKGLHIILCLDNKGALFIKRRYSNRAVTIFVKPPSLKSVETRIAGRCSKTSRKELIQRLRLAARELSYAKQYDYCVENDNLDKAVNEVKGIIQWAIFR